MEYNGHDTPTQRSSEGHDSHVLRPTLGNSHDAFVRSAFLSVDGCHSVGPSMEFNGHAPLAQYSSKGHDSHASGPTLGNSESPNTEGLHSVAPSMTPEVHEFIAPSRAHENSQSPDAKGIAAATSSVSRQVHAPSMIPQLRIPRSMAPHLCAPSMAPHLCVPTKMPGVNYSSAAPLPSVLPKGHGFLTSSKECPPQSVILQGPYCPANLATKRRNTPNPKDMVPKNRAAQCGANKKFPRDCVDTSSTIA